MSQTTPAANYPGHVTYYESPRPSNLTEPRSPTSYSSHAGLASPTTRFHGNAHAGPSSPPATIQHLPGDASHPNSPTKPTVTRMHSSSISAPSADHAAVAAALGREDGLGGDDARRNRWMWEWKWILLWVTLILVLAGAVAVGVAVSQLRHHQTSGGVGTVNGPQTATSSIVVTNHTTTSSAAATQNAAASSSAAASAATAPNTATTGPFPTATPPPSTSAAGSPTPNNTTGAPFTTGSPQTSSPATTSTGVPSHGD
ncbi:hypothetical protein FRC10_006249 [Ceratobasidium sp. 414]|nr:hypothetical protein FRC10_006249 [Ceratobasidium sp. 414]